MSPPLRSPSTTLIVSPRALSPAPAHSPTIAAAAAAAAAKYPRPWPPVATPSTPTTGTATRAISTSTETSVRAPSEASSDTSHLQERSRWRAEYSQLTLVVCQQPERARLCSFKEENDTIDRRPVDPPPVVELCSSDGEVQDILDSSSFFIRASLVAAEPRDAWSPSSSTGAGGGGPGSTDVGAGLDDAASTNVPPPSTLTSTLTSNQDYPTVRTPTGADATAGEVVQTPERLRHLNGKPGALCIFAKLSIRLPGVFRLKFTLYETSQTGLSEITHTISDPFEVFSPKLFKGMHESTPLTRHLAAQGLKVKLRTETAGTKHSSRARASVPAYAQIQQQQQQQQQVDSPTATTPTHGQQRSAVHPVPSSPVVPTSHHQQQQPPQLPLPLPVTAQPQTAPHSRPVAASLGTSLTHGASSSSSSWRSPGGYDSRTAVPGPGFMPGSGRSTSAATTTSSSGERRASVPSDLEPARKFQRLGRDDGMYALTDISSRLAFSLSSPSIDLSEFSLRRSRDHRDRDRRSYSHSHRERDRLSPNMSSYNSSLLSSEASLSTAQTTPPSRQAHATAPTVPQAPTSTPGPAAGPRGGGYSPVAAVAGSDLRPGSSAGVPHPHPSSLRPTSQGFRSPYSSSGPFSPGPYSPRPYSPVQRVYSPTLTAAATSAVAGPSPGASAAAVTVGAAARPSSLRAWEWEAQRFRDGQSQAHAMSHTQAHAMSHAHAHAHAHAQAQSHALAHSRGHGHGIGMDDGSPHLLPMPTSTSSWSSRRRSGHGDYPLPSLAHIAPLPTSPGHELDRDREDRYLGRGQGPGGEYGGGGLSPHTHRSGGVGVASQHATQHHAYAHAHSAHSYAAEQQHARAHMHSRSPLVSTPPTSATLSRPHPSSPTVLPPILPRRDPHP